jgi:Superfamily II DNA/RNA helicases, SNF2 family
MPGVTYLRLDGSVVSTARHAIVTKFNSDPTIDVLLLTTQVGGLGLNLTGADTVIFVDHDWSPMKVRQSIQYFRFSLLLQFHYVTLLALLLYG